MNHQITERNGIQNIEQKQTEEALKRLKKEYRNPQMSEAQVEQLQMTIAQAKWENRIAKRKAQFRSWITAVAAVVLAFIILPNTSPKVAYAMEQIPILGRIVSMAIVRDYEYESDRYKAEVQVPEIQVEDLGEHLTDDSEAELQKTVEEINAEIERITADILLQFEKDLDEGGGYQDVIVKGEVLTTTADYFTLKLLCYQGAGSGYQWNYYYTIDLNTGQRLQLKSIFVEGSDYIDRISEDIKSQMKAQMAADEKIYYWLDSEIEAWNFKSITDETSFYLNEAGNVVIGFNEGDVAPMYMGAVEFEIPGEVLADIRK